MTRSVNPRETVVQPVYCEVVEGSGKAEGSGGGQLGLSSPLTSSLTLDALLHFFAPQCVHQIGTKRVLASQSRWETECDNACRALGAGP